MDSGSRQIKILRDEPLARHTSWRIGGPARLFYIVENEVDLTEALRFAKENSLETLIIGAGTNLLVSDKGFPGVTIKLAGSLCDIDIKESRAEVGAAASLSGLARITTRLGLKGLEFAVGIPGTVGGGLVMNAGAHGGSIGDVVESVTVYTPKGELELLNKDQIDFGYRSSSLKDSGVIIRSSLIFESVNAEKLRAEADRVIEQRKKCQPGEARTAGSVFKNPQGMKAGGLIEEAGCKGMRVGGAIVSDRHANFIINDGTATATDILNLIEKVKKQVEEKTGVKMEEEICLVGEF